MLTASEETQLKYYQSFGKTKESVQEDVEIVKKWLQTQPHLPEIMEDAKIRNFLNMNKFSIERTKQKIDMYYTMRSITPELFLNPKWISFDVITTQLLFGFHPVLIEDKHRACFVSFRKKFDAKALEHLVILFVVAYEIRLKEDFIMDDLIVLDCKNLTLSNIRLLTPSLIYNFFNVYQKIYSLRIYKLIFINAPSYFSNIVLILKAILKPKIFDRVQVFKDDEILKEIFPLTLLPSNLGGNGPSFESFIETLKADIAKHQDRFDLLDTLKVDETLRAEELNNDEQLGYYGNFKKLNVD